MGVLSNNVDLALNLHTAPGSQPRLPQSPTEGEKAPLVINGLSPLAMTKTE